MLTPKVITLVAATWLGFATASLGQPLGSPQAPAAPKTGDRPANSAPARPFRLPFALMDTLDANHDGKLSADETQAAPETLKKLDKDHDGKLNAEEIGWPPRFPGAAPGGGPRGGGRGFPGSGPPGGPSSGRAQSDQSFAVRLRGRDANRDEKITSEELPRSMHWLIPLADQNKDGAIDEKEASALAEQLGMAASRPDAKSKTDAKSK